jgi:hypothetical protein
MIITTTQIYKKYLDEYIGKQIYFFYNDKPVVGIIEGFDTHQFFVKEKDDDESKARYGIQFDDKEFFLSIEDMLTWVKKQIWIS